MTPTHVIVDGSNIATEGRSTPSLAQLDSAVRAYQEEFPGVEAIVVVDATFGHRIDLGERKSYDDAVAHGELVSPPAGAIGRGDAFLLRVAERVDGQVLSNDSFQEFHGEHPWLFDADRLMGGKPVPGVGWIFTPRTPVRGPTSRAAVSAARRGSGPEAEPAPPRPGRANKAARKAAASSLVTTKEDTLSAAPRPASAPRGAKKAATTGPVADTAKGGRAKGSRPATGSTAKGAATKAAKGAATKTAKGSATKAAKGDATKVAKGTATKAAKGAATKTAKGTTTKTAKGAATKAAKRDATKVAKVTATKAAAAAPAAKSAPAKGALTAFSRPSSRRRGRAGHAVHDAIKAATTEALSSPAAPAQRERTPRGPRDIVNDPLTFLTFVTEHPMGSVVEGTVTSFTSHGANVDVGGMQCYVPLAGLGDPAPTRARDVLERGTPRQFTLVGLDAGRRVPELALASDTPGG
jgi:hypothetical protein